MTGIVDTAWQVLLHFLQQLPPLASPFWIYAASSLALVMLGGLMSGLTLGLLSMDDVDLQVLQLSGTPQEKRDAALIQPLLKDTHILLVTLLLWNAVAMEALPLVLGAISTPITAVILSVTLVLVFGEIVPQAVCSRYGLTIGARVAWLVKCLVVVSYPIAYPVGKLLDLVLGPGHSALFRRVELKALVTLHGADEALGGQLSKREIKVMTGALDLTSKIASVGMTPMKDVYMLSMDDMISDEKIKDLLMVGHSRIPVHQANNPKNVVGLLLVKELVLLDLEKEVPISSMKLRPLPCLPADTPMYDILKLFQTGHSHMVLLTQPHTEAAVIPERQPGAVRKAQFHQRRSELGPNSPPVQASPLNAVASPHTSPFKLHHWDPPGTAAPGVPVGIITVEDVIEELMQDEILDETDRFADNSHKIASMKLRAELVANLGPSLKRLLSGRHSVLGHPPPRPSLSDNVPICFATGSLPQGIITFDSASPAQRKLSLDLF